MTPGVRPRINIRMIRMIRMRINPPVVFATAAVVAAGCSSDSDRATDLVARQESRIEGGPSTSGNAAGSETKYRSLAPVTRRPIPPDVFAELAATKPALIKAPPPAEDDFAATLKHVGSLPPDSSVSLVVVLDDVPFDFPRLRTGDEAARASVVDERKAQLVASQAPVIARLTEAGGVQIAPLWLTNAILAKVPAAKVAELRAIPSVRNVQVSPPTKVGTAYDNQGFRNGTRANAFISAGLTGSSGGRVTGSPVRIAVVDAGFPDRTHVALSGRIAKVADCTTGTCVVTTAAGSGSNHGHSVSVAAMASIESGQDWAFPGSYTAAQTQRSGMAPGAWLLYYEQNDGASFVAGVQQAVADGADVINFSLVLDAANSICTAGYDWGGMNAALANALVSGANPVGCGGNEGTSTCSVWYPAFRPHALSVLPLGSLDNAAQYDTLLRAPYSSSGGMQVTRWDGFTNAFFTTAAVDLMTAADVTRDPIAGPATYSAVDSAGGCSLATPRVSGVTALMKHALKSIGWSTDGRVIQLAMLITGDGWNGGSPGAKTAIGASDASGFGRVHAHWPSSTSLLGPWGWGWRYVAVGNGEEVCWTVGDSGPEPSTVNHWKWVGTWYEDNLLAVADIDTRVYNACPGQPRTLLYSDSGYDVRTRAQLRYGDVQGKCLQMCAYGYSVPAGGRVFWSMDYFHGGNPDDH